MKQEQDDNEYELVLSQPKNPLWKIALSAFFFTFAFIAILYLVVNARLSKMESGELTAINKNVVLAMVGIAGGIYFCVRVTVLIDTDKGKLVTRYFLGFFSITTKTEIPELQYVRVAINQDEIYLVSLWYVTNKHYILCYSEEKEKALNVAKTVAVKLKIDLLDATEKGNSKWIDKTTFTE